MCTTCGFGPTRQISTVSISNDVAPASCQFGSRTNHPDLTCEVALLKARRVRTREALAVLLAQEQRPIVERVVIATDALTNSACSSRTTVTRSHQSIRQCLLLEVEVAVLLGEAGRFVHSQLGRNGEEEAERVARVRWTYTTAWLPHLASWLPHFCHYSHQTRIPARRSSRTSARWSRGSR